MKLRKLFIVSVGGLCVLVLTLWVSGWIQLFMCFPAEQVYVSSVSPDGSKVAQFSVKYQGIHLCIPNDIEPYYYLTIIEREHARILLRKTEYHGDVAKSFSELAKKYAPWAVTQLEATTQSKTFSNGGYTWNLGAVLVNGTNVPVSGMRLRPSTNEVSE